jgi:hypothetical protein
MITCASAILFLICLLFQRHPSCVNCGEIPAAALPEVADRSYAICLFEVNLSNATSRQGACRRTFRTTAVKCPRPIQDLACSFPGQALFLVDGWNAGWAVLEASVYPVILFRKPQNLGLEK